MPAVPEPPTACPPPPLEDAPPTPRGPPRPEEPPSLRCPPFAEPPAPPDPSRGWPSPAPVDPPSVDLPPSPLPQESLAVPPFAALPPVASPPRAEPPSFGPAFETAADPLGLPACEDVVLPPLPLMSVPRERGPGSELEQERPTTSRVSARAVRMRFLIRDPSESPSGAGTKTLRSDGRSSRWAKATDGRKQPMDESNRWTNATDGRSQRPISVHRSTQLRRTPKRDCRSVALAGTLPTASQVGDMSMVEPVSPAA